MNKFVDCIIKFKSIENCYMFFRGIKLVWKDYPIQDLNEYELDMDSRLNLTPFNRNFVFSLNTLDITLEYYNFKLTR